MAIKLKNVTEMPTKGQFIIVWTFNGKVWSDAYRFNDELLEKYSNFSGVWVVCPMWKPGLAQTFYYCIVVEDDGHDEDEVTAHTKRGGVLLDAHKVINGERQDTYGSPEDSFTLIAHYWNTYITSKQKDNKPYTLTAKDISLMMALFKIAREANQAKRDNLVDAAGYIGIAADLYVKPQGINVE